MKLRRLLLIGSALFLVLVKFTFDVIRKNVEIEVGGLSMLGDLLVAGAFVAFYVLVASSTHRRDPNPTRKLGALLVSVIVMLVIAIALPATSGDGFDAKNQSLTPLDYPTMFVGTFLSLAFGAFAVLVLRALRDLILFRPKRGTRRNFLILIGLVFATAVSTVMMLPLESRLITSVLFGIAILAATLNAFRLPWIVYLTKREKISSLLYGFFLFVGFTILDVMIGQSGVASRSLLYYSVPLKQFVQLVTLFGTVYFGMAFVSTLFHLPTAEAFDRKRSEVSSLHNLSRLVTQVFDFNELVDTVTSMTLQVCEAKACWLEVLPESPESRSTDGGQEVRMRNISEEEIRALLEIGGMKLRAAALEQRKPIVVDDVARDARFVVARHTKPPAGSLVVMPLISHTGPIGILYATKDAEYGFVKDDVELISAFADQAAVAIENSRLIKKSIERERLVREMLLAQEMQKKLLPQTLPVYANLDIDALSTPAFEVGGDYYDVVKLTDHTLGIVVGDVSGKGVSAAFYMSEVKGIFQALSRLYTSPREFMVKANDALVGSIDKHSFISLIYAVIDVRTGVVTIARAGHCPLLHVSDDEVHYVRPGGMGMGLSRGQQFDEAIEEKTLQLAPGDVCIFYTDGVTEARCGDEEYGYDRLLDTARRIKDRSAAAIKTEILESVKAFIRHQAIDDDLTLVVFKWHGALS
jgi:sigma-B regulation protein RsbU (phosphoserine phosphatase)